MKTATNIKEMTMKKKYVNEINYEGQNIVKWQVGKGQYVFAIGTKEFPNIVFAKEYARNCAMFNEAYRDDEGVYRWKSNNRVPFDDMLQTWGLSIETIGKCQAARDKDNSEFLADYRKRMENYVPSDEEMFEMRAAFGEETTVVNVITGQKIQL
jgi:hypothetical protein